MRATGLVAGALAWLALTVSTASESPLQGEEVAALVLVGTAFLLVGVIGVVIGPGLVPILAACVGAAWLIALLRFSRSSLPWTLSLAAHGLYLGPLVHLALVYPRRRLADFPERAVVVAAYAAGAAGPIAIALFTRDPASLGYDGFARNLVLIAPDVEVWQTLSAGAACVQALLAAVALVVFARRGRRDGFLTELALVVAAATALALPLLTSGLDARSVVFLQSPWGIGQWVAATLLLLAALALGRGLLVRRLARSGVAELVVDLDRSTSSDALRGALVRTLRDPSLTLALWDDSAARYVAADGSPLQLPPAGSGRAVTILERRGRRVGALVHDAALSDDPALIDAAAAAVRITLENDRLRDELRAQLEEVRASRARIVEAGDRERRRLERNLHDGAQQKLVSLAMALQLAARRKGDDEALADALEQAASLTRGALADVRALAQGLHPPVLREEGLASALETLAAQMPLPVAVTAAPGERLPEPVEITAYFVVGEALTNVVKYARASRATVSAVRAHDRLEVDVRDDGIGGADPTRGSGLRGLADRIASVDGRLEVRSPTGNGTHLHAEIPCA